MSMRLIIMILLLTVVCHGAACLWYMVGRDSQAFADGTRVEGWVEARWEEGCNATSALGLEQPARPSQYKRY